MGRIYLSENKEPVRADKLLTLLTTVLLIMELFQAGRCSEPIACILPILLAAVCDMGASGITLLQMRTLRHRGDEELFSGYPVSGVVGIRAQAIWLEALCSRPLGRPRQQP